MIHSFLYDKFDRKLLLRWILVGIAGTLAALLGASVVLLPPQYLSMIAVLLVGVPFLLLVINQSTQQIAIVLLVSLLPFTGILKAISGSRFAPLTFDFGIFLICISRLAYLSTRKNRFLEIMDAQVFAFILLAVLELFNPNIPSLQAGLEGFRKFAFMSIAFYAGRHVISMRYIRLFQNLLIFISVSVALYGIKQYFLMSSWDYKMIELATAGSTTYLMDGYVRPFSTMAGPFHLGLYLIITMVLLIQRAMRRDITQNYRIFLIGALVVELVAMFMTRTKGNWVGLVIGILVLILIERKNLLKKVLVLFGVSITIWLAALIILNLAPESSQYSITRAIDAISNPLDAPTVLFRLQLWRETMLPAIMANPVLGYGTSSAGEGLILLYAETSSRYFLSHNLYLKILLELGIFGVLLFASIIYRSIGFAINLLKQSDSLSQEKVEVIQWSLAVIIAFLFVGTDVPVLDAYPANLYFWLSIGFLLQNDRGISNAISNDPIS